MAQQKKAAKTTTQKRAQKATSKARKEAAKTQVKLTRSKVRANKASETKKDAAKSRRKEKTIGHAPHSSRISSPKGAIQPVASKTFFIHKNSPERRWLLVDADGQTVGRLASEVAKLLRGKHKPSFTPNNDAGDFVIVLNADKVKFSSNKETEKEYYRHSGWIGGLKVTTPARLRETYPERILWNAVKGMVPRTPLGRDQMRKLNIYAGDKHPHTAQKPVVWKLPELKLVKEA